LGVIIADFTKSINENSLRTLMTGAKHVPRTPKSKKSL